MRTTEEDRRDREINACVAHKRMHKILAAKQGAARQFFGACNAFVEERVVYTNRSSG